jgi:hypothetical protein
VLLGGGEGIERAPHGGKHVVAQGLEASEDLLLDLLEVGYLGAYLLQVGTGGEGVEGADQGDAQELLQAHGGVHLGGHALLVHLHRASGDAGGVRQLREGELPLVPDPGQDVAVHVHVLASRARVDEGRDPVEEVVREGLEGHDGNRVAKVQDAGLQGGPGGVRPDDQGGALEGGGEGPQLHRPVGLETVHVGVGLDDEEGVVPPGNQVEDGRPGVHGLRYAEAGPDHQVPGLVEQYLARGGHDLGSVSTCI